jgi:hypothetical protein
VSHVCGSSERQQPHRPQASEIGRDHKALAAAVTSGRLTAEPDL